MSTFYLFLYILIFVKFQEGARGLSALEIRTDQSGLERLEERASALRKVSTRSLMLLGIFLFSGKIA